MLHGTQGDYPPSRRLTRQVRDQGGQVVYDISYTYDQLGNRKTRYDAVSGLYTEYDYDVDVDPAELDFPTRPNRLLRYRVYAGQAGPLLRTVTYSYLRNGNASNITVKDDYYAGGGGFPATPGDPNDYDWHYDLALHYYTNGQVWRAGWSRWKCDQAGEPIDGTYEKFGMREFRYDDARARYLSADYPVVLEPEDEQPQPATLPYAGTDYLCEMPAGDAEIDYDAQSQTWSVEGNTLYLAGISGQQDAATEEVEYFHSDLLGSTSVVTDDDGERVRYGDCSTTGELVSYTAFGELVTLRCEADPNDPNAVVWTASIGAEIPEGFPRCGYVGGWGYESGLLTLSGVNTNLPPLALQHLGWRWYDPGAGRFVQRDPAGGAAAQSSYVYVDANPLAHADFSGLEPEDVPPWNWGDGLYGPRAEPEYTEEFEKGTADAAGFAVDCVCTALPAGWIAKAFRWYPRAKGIGFQIARNFRIDWHWFKLKKAGPWMCRPHYHRGPTKSQMKKHRPWEGGW